MAAALNRLPAPTTVPDLQLVPIDSDKQGFAASEPMVTQEQLRAVDTAVNAAKTTPDYRAPSDHFALEQQQHRGGL
jgi:hypothetical protein